MLPWYSWLVGFGLTLGFELPVVWWMLAPAEPNPIRRLTIGVLANLATHPLVWFFYPLLPIGYASQVTLSEAWAFGIEAGIYALLVSRAGARRAWLTSALANATSFGLGWIVVTRFGRWLF